VSHKLTLVVHPAQAENMIPRGSRREVEVRRYCMAAADFEHYLERDILLADAVCGL
jgi:hypothetical protein